MRFISWRGAGAALICALVLIGSERASAATTCEQEAVGFLNRFAIDSRSADVAGRARPAVDDMVTSLEKSGFWRRCGEVRGPLVVNLNLVKTLPAANLKTFLERPPSGGTLESWKRALMAAHPVNTAGSNGANADKCSSEAGLCKQDFETMFKNFNEIGGSQFYEATCVKENQDGKKLGRACDFLKNMKKEGIDDTTDSNAFIEKHSTCRSLKSTCSPIQFRRFKESMERVYRRWVVHLPQEIDYAVAVKFGGLKDCIAKMEKQKDVPGTSIVDWKADMTVEKYCRGVADVAIKAGEVSCNATNEHYDVETKKCYLLCPTGQKYVADKHKCEPVEGTTGGGGEGGGTKQECQWGVADPATGSCNPDPNGGGGA